MNKITYLFFITTLSSAHASLLHKDVNIEDSKNEAAKYPAVCKIWTESSKGSGIGTGTLCETKEGRKFILTSAHVICDEEANPLDTQEAKPLDTKVKIEFSDGTITPMLKSAIHTFHFSADAPGSADMGVLIPNAIPSTIRPMQIGNPQEFNEKEFVTSIGFGRRGTFDDTGRGFYLRENASESPCTALAVHMKVKLKTPLSLEEKFDLKDSLLERIKSADKLPLEGALSSGGSGGPVIQNNRVFATNTYGAKDLINLCLHNPSTHRSEPAIHNVIKKIWGEKLGKSLEAIEYYLPKRFEIPFRKTVKYILGVPDFSVNILQTMTFINDEKRNWLQTTVDKLLSTGQDAHYNEELDLSRGQQTASAEE